MGLEIGFSVYEKDVNGKLLVKHKLSEEEKDDTWSCGRCDVNHAWSYGCSQDFKNEKYIEAVFNKEFDGYKIPNSKIVLKYVDFNDFKTHVMEAVNTVFNDSIQTKVYHHKLIEKYKTQIKEYQELQLKCETKLVFNSFQELIDNLRQTIDEEQEYIDTFDEEDYDYVHAVVVQNMLNKISDYLKKGYVVKTYYSY